MNSESLLKKTIQDKEYITSPEKQEIHEQENQIHIQKRRKTLFTYSNPSNSMIEHLEQQRNRSFFQRNFRIPKGGSLRSVVLYWVRMTTGIGIMALPFYISQMGLGVGALAVILAGVISYFGFIFIFEAHEFTGKKDLVEISVKLLPRWITKVFKYSLILDIFGFMLGYLVLSWNLFCYLLCVFNLADSSWISDPNTMEFKQYNPMVILIRVVYLHVVFLISIPFLLKRSLESLRLVSFIFICSLFFLILMIFIQMPLYYSQYHHSKDHKQETHVFYFFNTNPNPKIVEYFFSIMLSYYAQPFVMTFRKELLVPSMTRLKKVTRISVSLEMVLFLIFGSIVYFVLGDKFTPKVVLMKKALDGYEVFEWIFRAGVIFFYLSNTIGICAFNVPLRDRIIRKYHEIVEKGSRMKSFFIFYPN